MLVVPAGGPADSEAIAHLPRGSCSDAASMGSPRCATVSNAGRSATSRARQVADQRCCGMGMSGDPADAHGKRGGRGGWSAPDNTKSSYRGPSLARIPHRESGPVISAPERRGICRKSAGNTRVHAQIAKKSPLIAGGMFWCFDGCSGPSPVDFAGYLLCREMHDNVFDRGPYCIERCITVSLARGGLATGGRMTGAISCLRHRHGPDLLRPACLSASTFFGSDAAKGWA